jgi:uncharacterized protein
MFRIRALLFVATVVCAVGWTASVARADGAMLGPLAGSGMITVRVTSMYDEQYLGIVRQHLDYSCGAASVATILRYGYNVQNATESNIIDGMLKVSDANLVRQRGFSLLDIKNYVDSLGLNGQGFKITYDRLLTITVPTIILLDEDGYFHFVVLRKATPEYVFVGDPIRGNQHFRADAFQGIWNGIIFVIAPGGGSLTYNRANVLEQVQAPAGMAQMANGMPPSSYMLNTALLQSIYIPAMDRL